MWISGYQGKREISEIVPAPNLKNKIGAGSALILSLSNSGVNPTRRAKATARQERFNMESTGHL